MIVVGAGLAGLRAAQVLSIRGRSVLVLERAPVVGGRLASRTIDGYVVDEGFQLVNPAYPELLATGVEALTDLRRFPGVLRFVDEDRSLTLPGPRGPWRDALAVAQSSQGAWLDLARAGALTARAALQPVRAVRRRRDEATRVALARAGLSERFVDAFVAPFLRGALLDDDLETSWRFTQLLVRSFTRDRPGTYPTGVAALPAALAGMVGAEIHLGETVTSIGATAVATTSRTYLARRVIVATDATSAHELVGVAPIAWRAQTTWWYATPRLADGAVLRLDRHRRVLTSALDVSAVAPERARPGRSLVAAATNGVAETGDEPAVREDVARLYGLDLAEVELVTTTTVEHALAATPAPLSLSRPSTWGDVVLAGDYLQTPSIQGALVSGRRAAEAVLAGLE